jgi:hypothetical protein
MCPKLCPSATPVSTTSFTAAISVAPRSVHVGVLVTAACTQMPLNGHQLNGHDPHSHHMLGALKVAIRHAILVMLALPDAHDPHRFQLRSIWVPVTDDPQAAYAYTEVKTPRIVPSPRDISRAEIVDSWLVWLRAAEGRRALYRIVAWSKGAPLWLLAQQERCSDRTIANRIDRSMAAILAEFLDTEMTVEPIEEPPRMPVRHYHAAWEATTGDAGVRERFGKVWIDGIGMMRDGRRLRDGREKADDKRLYRDRPPNGKGGRSRPFTT